MLLQIHSLIKFMKIMRTESLILKVLLCFNVFTLLMYIITPLSINSGYHFLNIFYIALNIFMMKLGFQKGQNKTCYLGSQPSLQITPKTFNIVLIFYLCTFTIRYAYMLYLPPLDFGVLINRIAIGVADPHMGRTFMHGGRTIPWTVYFITSVIDSIFFIFALICWKQLKTIIKILVAVLLVFEGFYSMGTGTNFGVIMLVSCACLAIMMQIPNETLSTAKITRLSILGIFALLFVVSIFFYNMEGRSGGSFEELKGGDYLALGSSVTVDTNAFLDILPYRFQILLLYIFSYLTQGYMFLENIYLLDFHWGGFFGNNPALQSIAQDFLFFNPELDSYQMQMERLGVDSYVNWHSCYLWLANDFTLLFVPLVIYYIAKFASVALRMYRTSHDLSSGIVFVVLANMLLFLFANNNYLSSVFYSFMFIFPYWYFKKYKQI